MQKLLKTVVGREEQNILWLKTSEIVSVLQFKNRRGDKDEIVEKELSFLQTEIPNAQNSSTGESIETFKLF